MCPFCTFRSLALPEMPRHFAMYRHVNCIHIRLTSQKTWFFARISGHNSSSNTVCRELANSHSMSYVVSFKSGLTSITPRSDHEVVAGELPGGVERQLVLADPAHGRRRRHLRLRPRPARVGPADEPVLAVEQMCSDGSIANLDIYTG